MVNSLGLARLAILGAVSLQAVGKIAYGTLLEDFPAPLFVFISFALTAGFFLAVSRKGVGEVAWGALTLLNIATALTFLCFFFALKLIEPAIVGAIEIGIGPVIAVLIAFFATRELPYRIRVLVCFGILAGCVILASAAVQGTGFSSYGRSAWIGISASGVAGLGAVLITIASKSLLERNWQFGAVLAHRFYLILPISLVLSMGVDIASIEWSSILVITLFIVSIVVVLAPLYLLQIGISRCDTYTVMVTMSALPILTFLLEGFSPLYDWSWTTAIGVGVVTTFLLIDVIAKNGVKT